MRSTGFSPEVAHSRPCRDGAVHLLFQSMKKSAAFRDSRIGKRDESRTRLLEALRRNGRKAGDHRALARLESVVDLRPRKQADRRRRAAGYRRGQPRSSGWSGATGGLIGFNPARGLIIGLWVGLDRIALHLADFAGGTLALAEEAIAIRALRQKRSSRHWPSGSRPSGSPMRLQAMCLRSPWLPGLRRSRAGHRHLEPGDAARRSAARPHASGGRRTDGGDR